MGRPWVTFPECAGQAAELVEASGKAIDDVARDLVLHDTTAGNRVRVNGAERGAADERGLLLTSAERAELVVLGRKNVRMRTEQQALTTAAASSRWSHPGTGFAFIDRERAHHDVRTVCRLLGLFPAWGPTPGGDVPSRPASAPAVAHAPPNEQVREVCTVDRKV